MASVDPEVDLQIPAHQVPTFGFAPAGKPGMLGRVNADILEKNLMILASAGSGKTYQLGNRVIGLVLRGAAPERIVALTFTRKAAGEFVDSVLSKLADAAADPQAASVMAATLGIGDADFPAALEQVVRALPRFNLGTIDGFFAKVVKGFQYELGLTGGRFELLEGPQAAAAADDLLAAILGDALADGGQGEVFFHAFRRASIGREDQGVLRPLREFVSRWQELYREKADVEWGPESLSPHPPDEWLDHKSQLAAAARSGLDGILFKRKGQREALEASIAEIENHVIGGGSLNTPASLTRSILEAVAEQAPESAVLKVKHFNEFEIVGVSGEALRSLVELAAGCELAAALQRTRAVREVVAVFDDLCARRLRNKGLLGFSDVKFLMGEWAHGEDARLRREAVDFRLDARIDHWLLDEFQDTSRSDWRGLQPLIDEAASGEEGSLFIVGDRKQAIYGWRGGDVGLFDEVIGHYGEGLVIAPMDESYRSCPEVLALVNRVCGDGGVMGGLFGEMGGRWRWHDHVSAAAVAGPEKRGEARVEVVGDWDQRLERLVEVLTELGVGRRQMTCGVLLRSNDKAGQVADHLRLHGFDVIEEGRREPAKDSPVGVAVHHLVKWLADPADVFSREVLEMSPLAGVMRQRHGSEWRQVWEAMSAEVSRLGFAGVLGGMVAACWGDWSDFGRRRAGDLLAALAALDARGGVSAAEAADWLARLEVSQSPGVAAVQVMTIHKSKGLGFDVVLLPDIPDDVIPQVRYFEVAAGDGWLSQTPAKWARALSPEMREAEARWTGGQQYEACCMLYVALTRAKRGLYVLLDLPAKSADPDKPSLANWLGRTIGGAATEGVAWQSGEPGWADELPDSEVDAVAVPASGLGPAVPRRVRSSPSAVKAKDGGRVHSATGMKFGTEVHSLFEGISWIDESPPPLPGGDAAEAVAAVLADPEAGALFLRRGRRIDLFREQTVDAILGGNFLSGVIDRLHLHRNEDGSVSLVEIIDFKTDGVDDPAGLVERYSGQMNAYREVMQKIHPGARVDCLLLSVRHRALVAVPA
jgi:ATP-dependent exoDNAse (exonuclease V) beta subunit